VPLESTTDSIRKRALATLSLGHTLQFDLGAVGVIYWDGTRTPPLIDNTRREAEATIFISLDNLDRLLAGTLDATMAYMTGLLKVQGSTGVALKLGEALEG